MQITPESFDGFLNWLDEDRNRAGEKYEAIRQRLVKMFVARGCVDAEGLADETIDRVIRKLPELRAEYVGEPALYFYRVARYMLLEHLRAQPAPSELREPAHSQPGEDDERLSEALSRCLEKLAAADRDLIIEYYSHEGREKIVRRRRLAEELKLGMNSLSQRAHRIRSRLESCIKAGLAESDDRPG